MNTEETESEPKGEGDALGEVHEGGPGSNVQLHSEIRADAPPSEVFDNRVAATTATEVVLESLPGEQSAHQNEGVTETVPVQWPRGETPLNAVPVQVLFIRDGFVEREPVDRRPQVTGLTNVISFAPQLVPLSPTAPTLSLLTLEAHVSRLLLLLTRLALDRTTPTYLFLLAEIHGAPESTMPSCESLSSCGSMPAGPFEP